MRAAMSCRRRPARWRASVVFLSFCLETKGPKVQGRLHRTSPRLSKRLTLRSRSAFCKGKRQAPLREGQPFSHPLRALPRPAAPPPRPPRSGFGVPNHGMLGSRLTAGLEEYVEWPAAAGNAYDPLTLQAAAWYLVMITPFPRSGNLIIPPLRPLESFRT